MKKYFQSASLQTSLQQILSKTIQLSNILNMLYLNPSCFQPNIIREFLRTLKNVRSVFKKIARNKQIWQNQLPRYDSQNPAKSTPKMRFFKEK